MERPVRRWPSWCPRLARTELRIPWSYWKGRPLPAEEYLSEPLITDPICRLDCDIPVDGVACFLFTSASELEDLPHPPVYVAGYATAGAGAAPAPLALALGRHHGGRDGDGSPPVGTVRDQTG